MGNCQAAEAATVVIEHPGGKIERFYWSLSACHVMAANPGHYVAAVIVKHLKLLRPDDTLLIGRVYRLVTFQEVLREFASKRRVKLSRLAVKQKGGDDDAARPTAGSGSDGGDGRRIRRAQKTKQERAPATMHAQAAVATPTSTEASAEPAAAEVTAVGGGGRRQAHQWRPALESIAETAGS